MDSRRLSVAVRWFSSFGCLAILCSALPLARAQDIPPPLPVDPNAAAPAPADPNVEVMTRGPVHEAYAVPVNSAGQTGQRRDRSQAAGHPDRRSSARHEARGPKRELDSRLLELGRRTPGFYLGQRRVARAAAWFSVDARLLAETRRARGSNGFPVTGCRPRPRKRLIFPSRSRASMPGPPAPLRAKTTSGSRATGNGLATVMFGSPAIGRHTSRTGSGCRPLMPGLRAAGSMCRAIGIIPWRAGDWSFRRSILPGPVAVLPAGDLS